MQLFFPQNNHMICHFQNNMHDHVANHCHFISQHLLIRVCNMHVYSKLLPCHHTCIKLHHTLKIYSTSHTSDVSKSVFSINSTFEDSTASTLGKNSSAQNKKLTVGLCTDFPTQYLVLVDLDNYPINFSPNIQHVYP